MRDTNHFFELIKYHFYTILFLVSADIYRLM